MVLRQRKATGRQGKVLIIDASTLLKRGRNQNALGDDDRQRIEALYADFTNEDGFSYVAGLDEITSKAFDLNISRYVVRHGEDEVPSIEQATGDLKAAVDAARAAEARLVTLLDAEGLLPAEEAATS
jgi:type I restriction enzyme M protein